MPDTPLEDMISHITANTTLTVVGGYLHETPDRIIACMTPEPGPTNFGTMGASIGSINIESPMIMIRARGASNDFKQSMDDAWTVYRAIHNTTNTSIEGTRYLLIEALQTPFTLGADENGRWINGFNLRIYKEPNS